MPERAPPLGGWRDGSARTSSGAAPHRRRHTGALLALGLVGAIVAANFMAGGRRHRGGASALRMLVVVAGAEGHNWMNSPRSRASRASTVSPCRQRTDPNKPHLQVNAGQRFHLEWSNGHYRSTHYFAVVRARDEHRLASVNDALLEDYLSAAPSDATKYEGAYWYKRHFGWTDRQTKGGASSHAEYLAEGKTEIAPGDADYIERPEAFLCSHLGQSKRSPDDDGNCVQADDMKLYRYEASAHADDVGVAYASSAHPWLLAVHRKKNTGSWAQQFDIAPMEVPASTEPGDRKSVV